MLTLSTPAGPVLFQPRDLATMPRNGAPPVICESLLRGVTVHWPGGLIGRTYRNQTTFQQLFDADTIKVRQTIAEHCARDANGDGVLDVSDVGYNYLVGRSGVVFEGRGWTRCGANGTLPTALWAQYPAGTTSSNAFYVAAQIITGTEAEFNTPTAEQWTATQRLYTYIVQRAGILQPHVNGHRDVRATGCPGDLLHGRLPEIAAAWPVAPPSKPEIIPPTPTGEASMLYIAVPKYPGNTAASEWWCFFESGAVRRAVNSDLRFATMTSLPLIEQDSKEHDDFLRSIAIQPPQGA